MSLLNTYSYLIANWLNAGGFSVRNRLKSTDIQVGYNTIFTKDMAKKVYRVSGIKPVNVDVAVIDYVRDRMFQLHPEVNVTFNVSCYPVRVDVNNEKFTRQMTKAASAYEMYNEAFEGQSGINKVIGKTYRLPNGGRLRLSRERLDELRQVYMSFMEIYNTVSAGETLNLVEVFVEITARELKMVKNAANDLYGLFGPLSMGMVEVKANCKSYLKEFGPGSTMPHQLHKKFLPQLLFTRSNLAAFSPYKSRGLVGGGETPLLLGIDYRSRLPFAVDIFKTASAQVFMLLGRTGSGKTYAAFQSAISALALGDYVSAIDVKGREWSRIAGFTSSKILTFDDKSPNFVNTLRLDDIEVDHETCIEIYNTAVRGTVSLLSLVVNLQPNEGNISDLEMVLREAVFKLYSSHGIDAENPKSFMKSSNLRYADLLPILESLASTATYTDAQKKMLVLARSRCHAFFGDSGIFAGSLQHEVTLGDVMDSKLVIYELNKNQGAMTDILDPLRVFMIQFLDSKKKAALRKRGDFLFCYYEELQRCEQFGSLLEYICADVTGSRSNNAVVFLLLNSLKVLQGQRAQDIRSNITSHIVGLVAEQDIKVLREEFGLEWVASQCELFLRKQDDYRNVFAASIDTGEVILETIYKAHLPIDLESRFQTRTTRGSKGNIAI